jgi:hypothetical protein
MPEAVIAFLLVLAFLWAFCIAAGRADDDQDRIERDLWARRGMR